MKRARPLTRPTHEDMLTLQALAGYLDAYGYGPSLRELANRSGIIAHTATRQHLLRLELFHLVTIPRLGFTRYVPFRLARITAHGRAALAEWQRTGAPPHIS